MLVEAPLGLVLIKGHQCRAVRATLDAVKPRERATDYGSLAALNRLLRPRQGQHPKHCSGTKYLNIGLHRLQNTRGISRRRRQQANTKLC